VSLVLYPTFGAATQECFGCFSFNQIIPYVQLLN